jgi:hypothetical protein
MHGAVCRIEHSVPQGFYTYIEAFCFASMHIHSKKKKQEEQKTKEMFFYNYLFWNQIQVINYYCADRQFKVI